MKKLFILYLLFISTLYGYSNTAKANVTNVSTDGSDGNYRFFVTIKSDETGCEQYANWWEVVSLDGKLLYRRILFHSHPNDQPFERSGGRINIKDTNIVYIRAHMNTTSYSGDVFKGSVKNGFKKTNDKIINSSHIEKMSPLPKGCAF